jgi:hypothetical protein
MLSVDAEQRRELMSKVQSLRRATSNRDMLDVIDFAEKALVAKVRAEPKSAPAPKATASACPECEKRRKAKAVAMQKYRAKVKKKKGKGK